MQAVKNTIPAIAEAMENIRQKVAISCYQFRLIRLGQKQYTYYISKSNSEIEQYNGLEDNMTLSRNVKRL